MTSSAPKYNTTGIPYAQHHRSCKQPAFGVINSSACGNQNWIALQNTIVGICKQMYQGGTGISIDRTGIQPIINWDATAITDIGNCATPLEIKGSTITYKGGHIFEPCPGPLNANPVIPTGTETLNKIKDQTYISIGHNMPFTAITTAGNEQYGVPIVFSEGSKVSGGVDNDMTFVMAPYQVNDGGTIKKGLAISTVDAAGVLTAKMIVTV